MYRISAEGYKNGGVHILIIEKTGEIWPSMKNAGSGTGVKNISDVVLKKYMAFVKQKTLQNSKLTNTQWQKEKFIKILVIQVRMN